MANKAYSLSHTKWMCKYHIVFTPKYRRKAIYGQIRSDIGEILRRLCEYKGVEIIEGHLMPDHVHMLLAIPPKYSVSGVMGYLKGKSSLMIFDKHANLKYKFGNRRFWAEGYYVSTVGLNEATIAKYIREQEAADIALDAGFRIKDLFRVVGEVTAAGGKCVTMTYWNPVLQYGPEKFAEDFAAAGGLGAIIPDLIPEEAGRWLAAAEKHGLDTIFLVAPSSSNERIALTTAASGGFVYATSHMGVTGAQKAVDSAAGVLVSRTREYTDLPVCVGLGVSNGEQAKEIAGFADGVIVGSALIKAAAAGRDDLVALAKELAAGVRAGERA